MGEKISKFVANSLQMFKNGGKISKCVANSCQMFRHGEIGISKCVANLGETKLWNLIDAHRG